MTDLDFIQCQEEYWLCQDVDDAFDSGRARSGPFVRLAHKSATRQSLATLEAMYFSSGLLKEVAPPTRAERIEAAWDLWECKRANTITPNGHHVDIVMALRKAANGE